MWGGLLAGGLDLLDAIVFFGLRSGIGPRQILQSIASGLLGPAAFTAGWPTAALGLVLHFFIALTAAFVYYLASLRWPVLIRRAAPMGILFGIAVYFFMQDIVLPLSAVRRNPFSLPVFLNGITIHALGIGLPIALAVRRSAHDTGVRW
jgi:uncharacterized membrane protein YagU involved in acid resistance